MKLLIDTNIILDVLMKRADFYDKSSRVLKLCEINKAEGFLSATSVTDVHYFLRKAVSHDQVRETMKTLLAIIDVAAVTKADIHHAFSYDMADYEDAVQTACAKRIGADYIVTRNQKDFLASPVKAVAPDFFLTMRL
jgi:predicted nucleic acid-binding protein